jgi:hypothetical protein
MKSLVELRNIAMTEGINGIAPMYVAQLGMKSDEEIAAAANVPKATVAQVREVLQIEPWDAPLPWEKDVGLALHRDRPLLHLPKWEQAATLPPGEFYLLLARAHDAHNPEDRLTYKWLSQATGYTEEEIRQGVDGDLDDEMRTAIYQAVRRNQID